MSRIGKRPIPVADGVQVQYTDREFSVKGPKGEMKMRIHEDVELQVEEGVIQLAPNASRGITPMLGTTWALVRNMLMGVSNGFVKELNLVGVGYRASTSSNNHASMRLKLKSLNCSQLPENVSKTVIIAFWFSLSDSTIYSLFSRSCTIDDRAR